MEWTCDQNEWVEVAKDSYEHGASLKKVSWKTPKKMYGWSTGRRAEEANMGESAKTSRKQVGVVG